ncbi:MAG TPA: hypothetical protein DDW52_19435, partial [Planctomycetaceae bacterium]|nr:hypothetical protein [Planctomycetaceae bacterium]
RTFGEGAEPVERRFSAAQTKSRTVLSKFSANALHKNWLDYATKVVTKSSRRPLRCLANFAAPFSQPLRR